MKEWVLGNRRGKIQAGAMWQLGRGGEVQGREEGEGLDMGKGVAREEKTGQRTGATGGEMVEEKEKWHEDGAVKLDRN